MIPEINWSSVLLPDPLLPTRPSVAPAATRNDTSRQRPEVGVIPPSSRTSAARARDDGGSDTGGKPSRRGQPRSRVSPSEQIGEGRLRAHEHPVTRHEHGERDAGKEGKWNERGHSIVEQRRAIGVDDRRSSGLMSSTHSIALGHHRRGIHDRASGTSTASARVRRPGERHAGTLRGSDSSHATPVMKKNCRAIDERQREQRPAWQPPARSSRRPGTRRARRSRRRAPTARDGPAGSLRERRLS